MANRFPLVLDVDSGNKIKELPSGDNLNLRESSIVNVQDVTALGTINAADIRVAGNRLVAQQFADLTDTPAGYSGSANYFVKVKADGTGLEFRPLSDLGNIEIDTITVNQNITPSADNVVWIGTDDNKIQRITAYTLKGDLVSYDDTKVFDATTGRVSYAALQGAPTNLSEFTDDIGFLRTADLDDSLSSLFDEGVPFVTDIQGSVFADDSTMLVDGVTGVIRANTEYVGTGFIQGDTIVISADTVVQLGKTELTDVLVPSSTETIGTQDTRFVNGYFDALDVTNFFTESVGAGAGLGVGEISSSTDVSISAGNRVKIDGAVPFRVSPVNTEQLATIAGINGDVLYNSTDGFIQFYQEGQWISLHRGTFTGNVTTASGQSDFNNVVVAGNLTVQGTTTTVDTDNTTIKDNTIVLNNGETGAGVTAGTSGIEIDRGSETNKTLVWDETDDKWTIGSETFVANTFEAVAFQGSLIGTNGVNAPLQIMSGQNDQTGNTIFINPYGSDTYISSQAETHTWSTGAYGSTTDPYVQFKTAGAFEALDGAYFKGNLTGDITGSVFGDDSSTLVDAVGNKIVGDVDSSNVTAGNAYFTNVYNKDTNPIIVTHTGQNALSISDTLVTVNQHTTVTNNKTLTIASGATIDVSDATITWPSSITVDLIGNVTGNIDNTTLTVGATDATAITIGNSGSTTTIEGTIQFTDALIANNLTADDSITITTEGNTTGEAISIGPGGSNTFVNLTADSIRFFGNITNTINAVGGIIGDLKGSVVADDSTVIIDGVGGTVTGSAITGAIAVPSINTGAADGGLQIGNVNDSVAVNSNVFTSTSNATTTISSSGSSVNLHSISETDARLFLDGAAGRILMQSDTQMDILVGTNSTDGDINITWGNVDIQRGNLSVAGQITAGALVGSVFADDSATIVDAVNYALLSDTLTLTPLNAEPPNVTNGMVAIADGVSWDPLTTGVQTMMVYLGGAWRSVATA